MLYSTMQKWYLFCEAEAEETAALAMADVKARGGVRIENDEAINLKVGQAAMWWFAIERHFLYHIANEQKHVINDSVCQ